MVQHVKKKKSNLFFNSNILMLKIRLHKCNGYLKKRDIYVVQMTNTRDLSFSYKLKIIK